MSDKTPKLPGPLATFNVFFDALPEGARVLIGYSGGLDSHVMLHMAAAAVARRGDVALEAIHVNHGLQAESDDWAAHCERVCQSLVVPLFVVDAEVASRHAKTIQEKGTEAAAREARYTAYSEQMRTGDFMLLAQHADDQAETFLLQALRGSGPDGLSAMQPTRKFADGLLCRPLLGCTRQELETYASQQNLEYIVDGSNADTRFDRNFLRHEVMPIIAQRWPSANRTLGRASARCHAASNLLLGLAAEDLVGAKSDNAVELNILRLLELPRERRFNALRLWIRHRGYQLPSLAMLREVDSSLLTMNGEGGVVRCAAYEFRRYRNTLFLMDPKADQEKGFAYDWPDDVPSLAIPEINVTLNRNDLENQGIHVPDDALVSVRSRRGGELLPLGDPVIHKSVKKLLQEASVPPWQRTGFPLIYINDELAAVWRIAVADRYRLTVV